jgi:hypothetical protein
MAVHHLCQYLPQPLMLLSLLLLPPLMLSGVPLTFAPLGLHQPSTTAAVRCQSAGGCGSRLAAAGGCCLMLILLGHRADRAEQPGGAARPVHEWRRVLSAPPSTRKHTARWAHCRGGLLLC